MVTGPVGLATKNHCAGEGQQQFSSQSLNNNKTIHAPLKGPQLPFLETVSVELFKKNYHHPSSCFLPFFFLPACLSSHLAYTAIQNNSDTPSESMLNCSPSPGPFSWIMAWTRLFRWSMTGRMLSGGGNTFSVLYCSNYRNWSWSLWCCTLSKFVPNMAD
jgi:hypothetical protein